MENENMNNGTQAVQQTATEPVTATAPANPTPVGQQNNAAPAEQKQESWLKQHWKGVAAGAAALVTAAASTFVAYKKGKANGIASVPMPTAPEEDYSLNPNE